MERPGIPSQSSHDSKASTAIEQAAREIAGQGFFFLGRRFDLTQHRLIRLVIETDDGDLADPQCWRSKISRRPEHLLGHFGNLRILHLEDIELLSLRDVDLRRRLRDRTGFRRRKLSASGDFFFDDDFFGIQKLGCSGTARSTLSDVVPVDLLCHARILLILV